MAGGTTQFVFKQNAKIPSLDNPAGSNDSEKGNVPPDEVVEEQHHKAQEAQSGLPDQRSVFSSNHLNYDITLSGGEKC